MAEYGNTSEIIVKIVNLSLSDNHENKLIPKVYRTRALWRDWGD